MWTRWTIRKKLALGVSLLLVAVTILAISGFRGAYAFRGLVRGISRRATELPSAVALAQEVSALRASLPSRRQPAFGESNESVPISGTLLSAQFDGYLVSIERKLNAYREKLSDYEIMEDQISDIRSELATVQQLEDTLKQIDQVKNEDDWLLLDEAQHQALTDAVDRLCIQAEQLTKHLQDRMSALQGDVRWHYRTWIILAWVTSLSASLLLLLMLQLFYRWVFRPLGLLIEGSRRVAGGDFHHRIHLESGDEMDELAHAMNDMTERFQQIRDDLDRQVQQRTREVIRGEQLASVGFLAAGVAHEINNPLASIALSAESLEERLRAILTGEDPATTTSDEIDIVRDYLRMIQDEAFRCKEITERLLDFSRLGDVEKQRVELGELVRGVIEMVCHVGKYREKHIEYICDQPVVASVNSQEIKQVVLNLITNGLESLDPGGTVTVKVSSDAHDALLEVTDNGCGMTDEVRAHVFEPFFTRRRDGQGTGLGMSISFRIVAEHGGEFEVHSEGPGQGSRFTVRLPLNPAKQKEQHHRYQAA